jgi:hypothetical protein
MGAHSVYDSLRAVVDAVPNLIEAERIFDASAMNASSLSHRAFCVHLQSDSTLEQRNIPRMQYNFIIRLSHESNLLDPTTGIGAMLDDKDAVMNAIISATSLIVISMIEYLGYRSVPNATGDYLISELNFIFTMRNC